MKINLIKIQIAVLIGSLIAIAFSLTNIWYIISYGSFYLGIIICASFGIFIAKRQVENVKNGYWIFLSVIGEVIMLFYSVQYFQYITREILLSHNSFFKSEFINSSLILIFLLFLLVIQVIILNKSIRIRIN